MTEPSVVPAEVAPSAMTPEQATAEIMQIRGNREHDWHHEARPGFDAAQERVMQLYQRAHSSTEPSGEPGLAPPEATRVRLDVFDDQYAPPQTAAELDAVPPPEFAPDAVKAGLRWDEAKLRAINAAAELEGLAGVVLEGRHVVARVASGPPLAAHDAERVLRSRWGSAFPSKLEAAHRGLDADPTARADLEARDLDYQPDVMEFWAKVGEHMWDPSTARGFARIKAKYQEAP